MSPSNKFTLFPAETFQARVFAWFTEFGRKNLPWQKAISPYRVWVSEIMLQQTQVATVIPYFKRFMKQFPTLEKLAAADLDQVLHYWSGLGYYARARNLHQTAKILCEAHQGKFPHDIASLESLPGIGRSTAGAILAIAYNQQAVILDGNVKRVLTRLHALPGWPEKSSVKNLLWEMATHYTPEENLQAYTQAMMDLGAMICTRTEPLCTKCPFQSFCLAYKTNRMTDFPEKKPQKPIPTREKQFIILKNEQGILLEKRPHNGIWGGLFAFPECDPHIAPEDWFKTHYGAPIRLEKKLPPLTHVFTHFKLVYTPVIVHLLKKTTFEEKKELHWYQPKQKLGLAAPVKALLRQLQQEK